MRKVLLPIAVSAIIVLTAGAAMAGMVNGTGKTHLGNTAGFNAKSNLTGSFEYNGDPNGAQSNISAHCDDYVSYAQGTYVDRKSNPGTYPKVSVTATNCADQIGTTDYKIVAVLVDEGEPGTYDFACIRIYDEATGTLLVHDRGYIQNGNIQIHGDNPDVDAELVATP